MGSLSDYFAREGYRATYTIGDRVQGKWNRIPFRGTVGNDRLVSPAAGPEVTVQLDLPIHHNGQIYRRVTVQHRDIRPLI